MGKERLESLTQWRLADPNSDVRGRILLDSSGIEIGRIEDMWVDTDLEEVTSITLSDGMDYPVEDLIIRDDGVYLRRGARQHRFAIPRSHRSL